MIRRIQLSRCATNVGTVRCRVRCEVVSHLGADVRR